ncbi:BOP3 Protein BOP3 [Candida maltosa Xu316]
MSVNSLIEKNTDEDDKSKSKSIPLKRPSSPQLQPPFQEQQQTQPHPQPPQKPPALPHLHQQQQPQLLRSPQSKIIDPGLLTLLGPNVSSFPFSEDAFKDALKLRAEQERTKQEYYKVETANKNLIILQTALRAQIPINMIPLMCVGNTHELNEEQMRQLVQQSTQPQQQPPPPQQQFQSPSQPLPQQQQKPSQFTPFQQQPQQAPFLPPGLSQEQQIQMIQANQKRMQQELQQQQQQQQQQKQGSPFQKSHRRGGSSGGSFSQQDAFNTTGGPPLGFRFGSGSSSNKIRPLSPAKIGAAAVANLATPTTPYRGEYSSSSSTGGSRRLPSHQRHASLPSDPPGNMHNRRSSQSSIDMNDSSKISPSMGSTSTLKVNPIPAQPLHKQSKSSVQPSQESMTSFQHVIQFHHWKPTTGGPQVPSGSPVRSHKRQKSSSASTPFQEPVTLPESAIATNDADKEDLTTPKRDEDKDDLEMDPDSSMDTSVSENTGMKIDESANPPKTHRRQESNLGNQSFSPTKE